MTKISNAIGGKLVMSSSTRTSPVFNPATGEEIATLPLSTNAEIDAAVAAAKAALPGWANTTPMKRARVLFKFKQLLDEHADELAREISREHGKVHD
ncbi:MAG: aldehyde dehydrogenase family protein, partial [Devosia nanyangense]|nr:aldehyde dehydrogenase family protein [Devosia nanyangense]